MLGAEGLRAVLAGERGHQAHAARALGAAVGNECVVPERLSSTGSLQMFAAGCGMQRRLAPLEHHV